MKNKLLFTLSVSAVLTLSSCVNKKNFDNPQVGLLQFVLFRILPDVYQEQMFYFIKNNNVKTISIVAKDLEKNNIDSLTYLEFNLDGKIVRRTTIECTTIGCLPYINRQEYLYFNEKLDKINLFTFLNNSNSTLYYWNCKDSTKMKLFDWEEYNYNGDTIYCESAISKWTFIKNHKNEIVFRRLMMKSTKQFVENIFSYSDSTIEIRSKSNDTEDSQLKIQVVDDGIKLFYIVNNKTDLAQHWILNSDGMPIEINTFSEGNPKRIINLYYTYY